MFTGDLSSWIRDCVLFLPVSQFVDFSSQDNAHLQVTAGSGMRMRRSGVISDLALWLLREKKVHQRMADLGSELLVYVRYRDEILAVVSAPKFCPVLTERLEICARPACTVVTESCSLIGVQMLDVMVFKHHERGTVRLAWRPYIHPTARHVPLASSSCPLGHVWLFGPLQKRSGFMIGPFCFRLPNC